MADNASLADRAPAAPGEPVLLRDDADGIATLTLNRPRAFNSLSKELLCALLDETDALISDRSVRVVVLRGNGRAFCAGHDLKEMGADRREEPLRELFSMCSRLMLALMRLPQPVIAVVDGIATAAGCQLVAACDLAVVSRASRFATSGIKYGLFCSTPMVALSRNVPRKAAMEMLLTGDFVDADEALRLGLVNNVVASDSIETALAALISRLMDKPADVLALGKRAFYEQLELGIEDAYALTTGVIIDNALGTAFAEGLSAFVDKRPPRWDDG